MDITKEKLLELGFEEHNLLDREPYFTKEIIENIEVWVDYLDLPIVSIATKNTFGSGYVETPVYSCNSITRLTTLIKLFSLEL